MDRMIFVNLPVADLDVSRRFYVGLGFAVNELFTDDQGVCIVVSDAVCLILLPSERFAEFAPSTVADPRRITQVLNALSADSRAEVDALVARALTHGGTEYRDAMEDGPGYARAVTDPDGHAWEFLYYDLAAVR
ncbi:VOC family protein [Georgenia faecalis]|uniref:VOC family protein n=1 Tax=Georgenia faecalis TaxID=2483799 RepID=UPI000FDB4B23|nr:VOC family protein [Georgenia faecalis]